MTTAYNVLNKIKLARDSERSSRLDPGSAGTLIVSPVDFGVCVMTGAGTRTLEDATGLNVGTSILCISQTDAIIVAGAVSITINDGDFVEFVVTKNSSGVNQWVVKSATDASASATFPVSIGAYELAAVNTAADNALAILQLITALEAAGVVTPAWTQGS